MLLAPSVSALQSMLNKYCTELSLLDLKINSAKSSALRIGSRHKSRCIKLSVANEKIEWAEAVKYLGIFIVSGPTFKCSFVKSKSKFYRSANSILSKIGNCDNATVTVSLMSSIALSILTYATEALVLNKSELNVLNHPWCRTFEKYIRHLTKTL